MSQEYRNRTGLSQVLSFPLFFFSYFFLIIFLLSVHLLFHRSETLLAAPPMVFLYRDKATQFTVEYRSIWPELNVWHLIYGSCRAKRKESNFPKLVVGKPTMATTMMMGDTTIVVGDPDSTIISN